MGICFSPITGQKLNSDIVVSPVPVDIISIFLLFVNGVVLGVQADFRFVAVRVCLFVEDLAVEALIPKPVL